MMRLSNAGEESVQWIACMLRVNRDRVARSNLRAEQYDCQP
jgi:hypothetical protein